MDWNNQEEGKKQANGNPQKFHTYCMSFDVAGSIYRPFWEGFPLCDIHSAITPDVLHQLYQGVFKHLVGWCQNILTPQELDRRIWALPPAFGLRQFKNGIFALSQISSPECKNMAKIILGCLVGCMPSKGIAAVTALLNFIYIAQYPMTQLLWGIWMMLWIDFIKSWLFYHNSCPRRLQYSKISFSPPLYWIYWNLWDNWQLQYGGVQMSPYWLCQTRMKIL